MTAECFKIILAVNPVIKNNNLSVKICEFYPLLNKLVINRIKNSYRKLYEKLATNVFLLKDLKVLF